MRQYTWPAHRMPTADSFPCQRVTLDAGIESGGVNRHANAQASQMPITVVVTKSQGQGAVASSTLQPGQLIGEYTGEVLDPVSSPSIRRSRDDGAYFFDLNCHGLVVDASRRGNLSRFINHAASPSNNVLARVTAAGGLRKILLYAACSVDEGEALLLDYGYSRDGWV